MRISNLFKISIFLWGCFSIPHQSFAQFSPAGFGNNNSLFQNNSLDGDTTSKDSTTNKKVKPKNFPKTLSAEEIWYRTDTLRFIDSQLLLNHRYTPNQRSSYPILQLGVPGSPQHILYHQNPMGGFTLGPTLNTTYNIQLNQFSFHQVGQPYTRFQYAQGDGRFTGLEALHTQNFSPTWNVTLLYRSTINEDMYTGATQDNLSRNLGLGSNFISQNKRYEHQIIFTWNRNRRLENGGLKSDTLFYGNDGTSDQFKQRSFGIYLPQLAGAESFLANTQHRIIQRYYLHNLRKHYLWHQFDYINQRFTYSDKSRDTQYYGSYFNFNSGLIRDSTSLRNDVHKLGWGFDDSINSGILKIEGTYTYQNAHLRSKNKDSLTQSEFLMAHGYQLYSSWRNHQNMWQLQWNHLLTGYLSNNNQLLLGFKHRFHDSAFAEITLNHRQQSASIFHTSFLNNHFDFRGNLPEQHRIKSTNIDALYAYRSQNIEFKSALSLGQINGEVRSLFDPKPVILDPYFYIQSNFEMRYSTKNWMFFGSYHIQKNTAKEWNNLGLPTHFTKFGISYQNSAFSKALIYRLGFDAAYSSQYEAWIYRADTRQFMGANNGVMLGNYPVLDVFFSARIKTIDLFFKYEHLNHWWITPGTNRRYESTLNYPIQPDRFRFGFIWHFWN